ncbi:hypothetical protein ACOMHN_025314 [Nucella lapillus]
MPAADFQQIQGQESPQNFADDFSERRPLPEGRVYHFNVIYNHARCPLSATADNIKALNWTRRAVERLQLRGLVNTYYHDRDCPKGLSFREEMDRVMAGSEVTVLLLTPGFLQECWPRYWLLPSFRSLFTSGGSDDTPEPQPPLPPPPPPPPLTSSYPSRFFPDDEFSNLDSSHEYPQDAEISSCYPPVISEGDSLFEERAVNLATSLFASAYYPSNCLENLESSSASSSLTSNTTHCSSYRDSELVSSSTSFSKNMTSLKTSFDSTNLQTCKKSVLGSKVVVVVVVVGVGEGEVPEEVKGGGKEVLFFRDDCDGQDAGAWSRLEGFLLAAVPPSAASTAGDDYMLRWASADRRQQREPSSEHARLWPSLTPAEEDLKYTRTGTHTNRTTRYPVPGTPYRLQSHHRVDSSHVPRPRKRHLTPLMPLSSIMSAGSSPVLPKRHHHRIPAERERLVLRNVSRKAKSRREQRMQEDDGQEDHVSGLRRSEWLHLGVSALCAEISRDRNRTDHLMQRRVQDGQQESSTAAKRWHDIQEIPCKLPRDEAEVSAAKIHTQNDPHAPTTYRVKEENGKHASNIEGIRQTDGASVGSQHCDARSSSLECLEKPGIGQEARKDSSRAMSRSSTASHGHTPVSRRKRDDRPQEVSKVPLREQSVLLGFRPRGLGGDKTERVSPASEIFRKPLDRHPTCGANDTKMKTENTKQKTNDGHGVFSVEDNHSLTDYLSSSFVTSDDGTLSSSAEWCCGCGACGNDSGFLSGGLCSFGGDISPRMSTPRTRTQDNHQQTYEEKVIKNLEPEIVTSHTLDQIEEAIFAEEQCHGLRFASAPLEAHSIAKKISNKGRDLRSKDFAVIEGIPTTKTEDCAVTEGKHTTKETISSSYLPLDLPDFPTESLRLEPATEEPRRHVLTKKTVHVKAKEVSMSSSGVVEAVFTSGQRESEENGEGRSAQSQVTDHRAARADAATVSQAEGGVAVTQTEHMSEEETSAEGRSMPRRLLPEVVRVICHAISRPENPYF